LGGIDLLDNFRQRAVAGNGGAAGWRNDLEIRLDLDAGGRKECRGLDRTAGWHFVEIIESEQVRKALLLIGQQDAVGKLIDGDVATAIGGHVQDRQPITFGHRDRQFTVGYGCSQAE